MNTPANGGAVGTKPSAKRANLLTTLAPSRTVLLLVDSINPMEFDGAEELAISAIEAAKCVAALKRRLNHHGWH